MTARPASGATATMLSSQDLESLPTPVEVMTVLVELPPGDPGTPPHRHSGPVFAYMLEGEMVFEPMLTTLVDEAELAQRRHLRVPGRG